MTSDVVGRNNGRIRWPLLRLFLLALQAFHVLGIAHDSLYDDSDPSHIVLKLKQRDDALARKIARDHGMILRGEPFLESHYFVYHDEFRRKRSPVVSARRKRAAIKALSAHPDVHEVILSRARRRVKRDYISSDDGGPNFIGPREKRQTQFGQSFFEGRPVPRTPFPDPLYVDQWYLTGKAVGGYDMNVREAWSMGYAGRNVSISILDDGIQRDHLDLAPNYDQEASTDINDHDNDPTPQNNGDNKHGTRCAGEVSAIAGNDVCGVGVAFHSKIGGVRMLDGPVSDSVEAASLSLNQQHIDIYSASWGPEDDGKTFDGPGNLAQEAFYRGVKQGRGGRGNIFVWASGNGGSRQDSCSADGYTTSIYTLSISSATFDNHRPWYLEECPSTIATTYSSANINQPAIVTVDVPSGCTKMHTGTSASAPLAAGIIALALEANPSLTWRDTQHIVLRTANPTPLLNNPGWSINGVGRRISNKFGYGLMDAGALVKLARVWRTVPEQHMCAYEYTLDSPRPRSLMGRFKMNFSLEVSACRQGTPVVYLEHVQVVTTIRYAKRGDLTLTLYSPMGTKSQLLPPRPQDFNQNGFHKWPFLSVQMWGEDPRGIWTLEVESVTDNPKIGGVFNDWTLLLYGTEEPAQSSDQRYSPYVPASPRTGGQFLSAQVETKPGEQQTIAIGDLTSTGNCHPECVGCSEPNSAVACHSCKHFTQSLRNRAGFRCVTHCDEGFYADGDKCKKCNGECQSCTKAEECNTCHGALLLIDVNHFAHFDHGRCVEHCPFPLVPDYTMALQAKCVLKKNPCGDGYYEDETGGCSNCHEACSTCHGAGPIQCDTCAPGYGNHSIGFCRPCCDSHNVSDPSQCEDCTKKYPSVKPYSQQGLFGESIAVEIQRFLVICGAVLFIAIFFWLFKSLYCLVFGGGNGKNGSTEYTPLRNLDEDEDEGTGAGGERNQQNKQKSTANGKKKLQQQKSTKIKFEDDDDDDLDVSSDCDSSVEIEGSKVAFTKLPTEDTSKLIA